MLLPNKLFSYEESALPLMPEILRMLDHPKSHREIYQKLSHKHQDTVRLIEALDCLYAMQKVELDDEGRIFLCSEK